MEFIFKYVLVSRWNFHKLWKNSRVKLLTKVPDMLQRKLLCQVQMSAKVTSIQNTLCESKCSDWVL